jgi:hypothetical protein
MGFDLRSNRIGENRWQDEVIASNKDAGAHWDSFED